MYKQESAAMLDFMVNGEELEALYGLPYAQQLAYLRGIRPFMDLTTGLVGVKRRISLQSIAEAVYVEAHPGVKSVQYSRAQVRRTLATLERLGLISLQSEELQLILKCNLATLHQFAQNKVVTNPSQEVVTVQRLESLENKCLSEGLFQKVVIDESSKAVRPLIKDNYIYFLLQKFETFWALYPEKKSKQQAWLAFELLKPDEVLFSKIIQSLNLQIQDREQKQQQGVWVPPWKYPGNWLAQRSWEDEVSIENQQEIQHAINRQNTRNQSERDLFWSPEIEEDAPRNNVLEFKTR